MSGRTNARRRARRWRLLRRCVLVAVVLLVTVGAVYAGLRASPDTASTTTPRRTASAHATPTALASLDLSGLPIERAAFCDRLDKGDVEDALDGPVASTAHYGNGDRATLAPGVTDVAHEYDCTFRGASGAEAQAWVFAEPVTASVGRSIVREATSEAGCRPLRRDPTFGTPSVGTLCTQQKKPVARAVTLRGLFGDAWLSCRLSRPGDSDTLGTVQAAEQWCVRVATTLGARP